MNTVEFYSDNGKVGYSIFDGEVFTEEDYDSLEEQGEFEEDNGNDVILTDNMIREFTNMHRNGQSNDVMNRVTTNLIDKNRKRKRKHASKSRKINRYK